MNINDRAVSPEMGRAAVLLQAGATGLCAFYLALRPLSPGLDVAEPEGAFLAGISFLAALLCALGLLARREWILPHMRFWGPLAALALCSGFAVFTATNGGNYQLAADLGNLWLSDLFLIFALCATARRPGALRLYLAALAAGIATADAYTVYQRFYGMPYFRHLYSEANGITLDPQFAIRINSDRASGPFSYANALAAVCLLTLPLLAGFARQRPPAPERGQAHGEKQFFSSLVNRMPQLALLLTVAALVYSGSKAGNAVAVLVQYALLVAGLPAGRRGLRGMAAAAGWLGLGLAAALALAAPAFWLAGAGTGLSIFALGWFVLLLRMPDWLPRLPRWPGIAALLLAVLAVVLAATVLIRAPEDSSAGRARTEIRKQVNVRLNYWRAAVKMIGDHPLQGVGLDNFSDNYSHYKVPGGWEVKRAHNHYLQLAADGGLPLLLAFLTFWGLYLTDRHPVGVSQALSVQPPAGGCPLTVPGHPEQDSSLRLYRLCGLATGSLAFLLTYYFSMKNAFVGLGVEFYLAELAGGPGSIRQQTGSVLPLMIHGGVHLFLLPLIWGGVFVGVWRLLAAMADRMAEIRRWLVAGLVAVLLHGFFDFSLYHTAVAGLFWAVCVLARFSGRPDSMTNGLVRLRLLPARLAMVAVLAGGMSLFLFSLSPRLVGSIASTTGQKIMMNPPLDAETLQEAKRKIEMALQMRPQDSELHRLRAQLLEMSWKAGQGWFLASAARDNLLREALQEYAVASQLAPRNSASRIAQAQAELRLNPDRAGARNAAAALLRDAVERYPNKAAYRLLLAVALRETGRTADAAREAQEALRLHGLATDDRLRLSPEQQMSAREIVRTGAH